jgi:hypothetical protein
MNPALLVFLVFMLGNVKCDFGYQLEVKQLPFVNCTADKVFLDNDESYVPMDIGFDFNFFGNLYSIFYLNSNGFISFVQVNTDIFGDCYANKFPNESIMIMLSDLNPAGIDPIQVQTYDSCYVHKNQTCTVIEFSSFHYFDLIGGRGELAGTWEIFLFYDGDILLNYLDTGAGDGIQATSAIKGSQETVKYKCNQFLTTPEEEPPSVLFTHPNPGTT